MKAGAWATGKAAWCAILATLEGFGSAASRLPHQRGGLGPSHRPRAVAKSNTNSMREPTRLAVSVLLAQMGSMAWMTCAGVMSLTCTVPSTGQA